MLEGWCLGIQDHPQWFREADDLRLQIAAKRKACAWEVHDLTAAYITKAYTNAKESRSGALQGVVSVLLKHKSATETGQIIDILKGELEKASKAAHDKETLVYKERVDSITDRIPIDNDFANPISGVRRIMREEHTAKQIRDKQAKEAEAALQATKAATARETGKQKDDESQEEDFSQAPYPRGGRGGFRGNRGRRNWYPRSRGGRGRGRY